MYSGYGYTGVDNKTLTLTDIWYDLQNSIKHKNSIFSMNFQI